MWRSLPLIGMCVSRPSPHGPGLEHTVSGGKLSEHSRRFQAFPVSGVWPRNVRESQNYPAVTIRRSQSEDGQSEDYAPCLGRGVKADTSTFCQATSRAACVPRIHWISSFYDLLAHKVAVL